MNKYSIVEFDDYYIKIPTDELEEILQKIPEYDPLTNIVYFEGNFERILTSRLKEIEKVSFEIDREKDPMKKEILKEIKKEYILKAMSEYKEQEPKIKQLEKEKYIKEKLEKEKLIKEYSFKKGYSFKKEYKEHRRNFIK